MGSLNLELSKIKNIVFDLDDTLVGSSIAYDCAMDKLGIDKSGKTFQAARKATKEQLPHLAPAARNRFLYFKNYLEIQSQAINPAQLLQIAGSYDQFVAEHLWQQWKDLNRLELMQNLKTRGYRIFVLTNESLRLQTLKLSGFSPEANWLSGYLVSEEIGYEKPHPKIFESFFKRFQLSPAESVMIGDSFEKDIQAGIQFGMQAVHTLEFLPAEKQGPTTIQKLEEIISILKLRS